MGRAGTRGVVCGRWVGQVLKFCETRVLGASNARFEGFAGAFTGLIDHRCEKLREIHGARWSFLFHGLCMG